MNFKELRMVPKFYEKYKEVKMKVRIDIMNKTKYKNNKHYCYISLKSHFK